MDDTEFYKYNCECPWFTAGTPDLCKALVSLTVTFPLSGISGSECNIYNCTPFYWIKKLKVRESNE
jgi:hypothetical protein